MRVIGARRSRRFIVRDIMQNRFTASVPMLKRPEGRVPGRVSRQTKSLHHLPGAIPFVTRPPRIICETWNVRRASDSKPDSRTDM